MIINHLHKTAPLLTLAAEEAVIDQVTAPQVCMDQAPTDARELQVWRRQELAVLDQRRLYQVNVIKQASEDIPSSYVRFQEPQTWPT